MWLLIAALGHIVMTHVARRSCPRIHHPLPSWLSPHVPLSQPLRLAHPLRQPSCTAPHQRAHPLQPYTRTPRRAWAPSASARVSYEGSVAPPRVVLLLGPPRFQHPACWMRDDRQSSVDADVQDDGRCAVLRMPIGSKGLPSGVVDVPLNSCRSLTRAARTWLGRPLSGGGGGGCVRVRLNMDGWGRQQRPMASAPPRWPSRCTTSRRMHSQLGARALDTCYSRDEATADVAR